MIEDYLSRLSSHEPACLHTSLHILSKPVGPRVLVTCSDLKNVSLFSKGDKYTEKAQSLKQKAERKNSVSPSALYIPLRHSSRLLSGFLVRYSLGVTRETRAGLSGPSPPAAHSTALRAFPSYPLPEKVESKKQKSWKSNTWILLKHMYNPSFQQPKNFKLSTLNFQLL